MSEGGPGASVAAGPSGPQISDIRITFDTGESLLLSLDTYGFHGALERWLASRGWRLTATAGPPGEPCRVGRSGHHRWEAGRITGITFRRCARCGRWQRRLYRPWYEDFAPADPDGFLGELRRSPVLGREAHDLAPGTVVAWR